MTEPINQEAFEKLTAFLKDDVNAVKFCVDMLFVGHLWDDLIDKDRTRDDEEINRAFGVLLVDNHINPFYQRFAVQLDPLLANAALLWLTSTRLEKGDDRDKLTAFIIRNAFIEIINYCGLLLGGPQWVIDQGPDLWRMFNLQEKYQEFINE
jgi:hypothetical protein